MKLYCKGEENSPEMFSISQQRHTSTDQFQAPH